MAPTTTTAPAEIRDQLAFLGFDDADVIELQALRCETSYGSPALSVFVRADRADGVLSAAPTCQGVYLIANGVHSDVTLRRAHRVWTRLGRDADATTDRDIPVRRVLPIDCDAIRTSGISATDAERACARQLADQVRALLISSGVPELAIGEVDSGNGYQVWIALAALPVSEETDGLIRRILAGLAGRVSVDGAKVDVSIHDRKRLLPVAGTMKRKGISTPERPHRMVTWSGPALAHRLSVDDLRQLADTIAPVTPAAERPPPTSGGSVYDRANGLDPHDVVSRLGLASDGRAVECPGCRRQSGTMAAIVESTAKPGTSIIKCQSATCSPHRGGVYTMTDATVAVRGVTPTEAARWLVGEESPPTATDRPRFVAVNAVEIARPLPPVPFIVPDLGFARSSAPNCIGGYGYSRKTLALQDAALSIAAGAPVWGRFACAQANVVHVDYEQGDYLTHQRYQRLAHARGIDLAGLGDRLRFVTSPGAYLDSEGIEDDLVRLIEESQAGFVIVDSLKAATPTLEENSSAIRIPLDILLRVSTRTGACVTVIHHARKPSRDDTGGAKTILRGSSAIFDACSSVLTFTSETGEPTEVQHPKNRWTGKSLDPFYLDSEDTDGGQGLRVYIREDMSREEPPWMLDLRQKFLSVVMTRPGIKRTELLRAVAGNMARKVEALNSIEASGEIMNVRGKGIRLAEPLSGIH